MWENRYVSKDLKDAIIITTFKKGDKKICGNHFIAVHCRENFCKASPVLSSNQCRRNLSWITMQISTIQKDNWPDLLCSIIKEKNREEQKPPFLAFYDLEKAFDSVPRPAMWKVLAHFISLVQGLHDGMTRKSSTTTNCWKSLTLKDWKGCVDE